MEPSGIASKHSRSAQYFAAATLETFHLCVGAGEATEFRRLIASRQGAPLWPKACASMSATALEESSWNLLSS